MIKSMSTRAKAAGAAVAVMVLAGGVILLSRGDDPEAASSPLTAPTTTSSTTSTTATTTTSPAAPTSAAAPEASAEPQPGATTAPRSDAGPYQVATATVSEVEAQLAAPAGVDTDAPPTNGRPAFSSDQRATQPLPRIEQPVEGRFATSTGYRFSNPQPFGDALTFLVVRRSGDWVQVQLPVRPNGTTAWVKASDVTLSEVTGHVEVNVAERNLRLFEGDQLVAETPVAVGTNATRTPTGRHFITDKLDEPQGAQRYPWSLGISAYSEQLDTFDGGAPQVAMHGWRDSSAFGSARSNGCIRVPDAVINQLAALPLGTPVDVYAA